MRQIRFALPNLFFICFLVFGCAMQVAGESLFAQQSHSPPPVQSPAVPAVSQSPSASPAQTPPSELGNLQAKVQPSVVWVTTFDSKGNLLRTESGFFITADGRVVTTANATERS